MANRRRLAKLDAGKAPYVSKNRGLALLDEAIEQIELHQKYAAKHNGGSQWYQEDYRCGSGMCLAGWISQLAGGVWLHSVEDGAEASGYLAVEPMDAQDVIDSTGIGDEKGVHAHERATRLLGPEIGEDYADMLFVGDNTLSYICEVRDEIAEALADE